jgi:hypothetical protein
MSALCQVVDRALPGAMGDTAALPAALRAHVGSCLRCQTELVRYRKISRHLASLAPEVVPAPPGLRGAVIDRIGPAGAEENAAATKVGRAAAAAGALVAAAGTVAVVRWIRTHSAA